MKTKNTLPEGWYSVSEAKTELADSPEFESIVKQQEFAQRYFGVSESDLAYTTDCDEPEVVKAMFKSTEHVSIPGNGTLASHGILVFIDPKTSGRAARAVAIGFRDVGCTVIYSPIETETVVTTVPRAMTI